MLGGTSTGQLLSASSGEHGHFVVVKGLALANR